MVFGIFIISFAVTLVANCQDLEGDFIHRNHYTFEFGEEFGNKVYETAGHIGVLNYNNIIPLFMAKSTVPNYVRVKVTGISKPTVLYDRISRNVSIDYTFPQLSSSSYDILVLGRTCVPNEQEYLERECYYQ